MEINNIHIDNIRLSGLNLEILVRSLCSHDRWVNYKIYTRLLFEGKIRGKMEASPQGVYTVPYFYNVRSDQDNEFFNQL